MAKKLKSKKPAEPQFQMFPFKDDQPILITNSLIKTFQDCRRLFLFKYIYRFTPIVIPKPFIFGTHFGLGLDDFYSKGSIDVEEILEKYFDVLQEFSAHLGEEEFSEYRKQSFILEGLLTAYPTQYADDLKKFKYIGHEMEFKFPLPIDTETSFSYNYGGKIDLVLQAVKSKEIVIQEHKTASQINRGYILKLALDTQVTGYLKGGDILGLKAKRVIYNINGKAKLRLGKKESEDDFRRRVLAEYETNPNDYFVRQELSRSGAHIDDFLTQLKEKVYDIDIICRASQSASKSGDISHLFNICYRSENHCVTPWGTCPFIKVCSGKNGMDPIELNTDFVQREEMHSEISKETQE